MKCILHIGLEKTGTTSLQTVLAGNRSLLREKGILFPVCLGARTHINLATICRNSENFDQFMIMRGITNIEQQSALYDVVYKELEEQVSMGDCHTLLISNEHLSSKLQTKAELYMVKEFLSNFCTKFSIIVYLREQSAFFRSTLSTEVRSGKTLENLPRTPMDDPLRYDYHRLLSLWSEVFGEHTIKVSPYEEEELVNNDVVDDFLLKIGLDGLDMSNNKRKNVALGLKMLHFRSMLNQYLPVYRDDTPNPIRRWVNQQLDDLETPDIPIPVGNIQQIRSYFAESNAKVANHFLGRTYLFSQNDTESESDDNDLESNLLDANLIFKIFSELLLKVTAKTMADKALIKAKQSPDTVGRELKQISDAIKFLPNNKYLHFCYSKLLFLTKHYAESEMAMLTAMRLGFDQPSAWVIMSRIHEKKNDLGKSIEFMRTAIKLNDSSPNLYRRLDKLLAKAGQAT